jgi:competence protein ComEC
MTPALLGVVFGSALQLQQPALWGWTSYALMLVPVLAWFVAARLPHPRPLPPAGEEVVHSLSLWERAGVRAVFTLVAFTSLAFALCGLRSVHFAAEGLDPGLEGRDIVLTGVVAAMPQRNETGLRFRLEVESASMAGAPVRIPPQLYLGWYGGVIPDPDGIFKLQRQTPELHAGERWQMTLRLKAPHGNSKVCFSRDRQRIQAGAGRSPGRPCSSAREQPQYGCSPCRAATVVAKKSLDGSVPGQCHDFW